MLKLANCDLEHKKQLVQYNNSNHITQLIFCDYVNIFFVINVNLQILNKGSVMYDIIYLKLLSLGRHEYFDEIRVIYDWITGSKAKTSVCGVYRAYDLCAHHSHTHNFILKQVIWLYINIE